MAQIICTPGIYYHNSDCGYCENDASDMYGFHCIELSCDSYQKLLDRGFRRSGRYLYKPNLRFTCCPQYTIRLNVENFEPSKNLRKKWCRLNGGGMFRTKSDLLNCPSSSYYTTLDDGEFTYKKFRLYKKYQMAIHKEDESEITVTGFKRFLCDSPFPVSSETGTDMHNRSFEYGLHHQLYYMEGKFIAFGVLDILPSGISSVYFVWDPEYARYSLGTIGAMTEIQLARQLKLPFYYLGNYIHDCAKMSYKARYKPSFLLDPDWQNFSNEPEWHPIDEFNKEFNKGRKYFSFHDEKSLKIDDINDGSLEYRFQNMPGRITPETKLDDMLREANIDLGLTILCITNNARKLSRTSAKHTILLKELVDNEHKNLIVEILKDLASLIGPELAGKLQLALLTE